MSDWDQVTKIGSRTRGGGASERETVVRNQAQLNAARRTGAAITTEKKFATAQKASAGLSGQHMTKVDRSDDIIKPKTVPKEVAKAIIDARRAMVPTWNQEELARKAGINKSLVEKIEKPGSLYDLQTIMKIEKALQIGLRGKDLGVPKPGKQFKRSS